METLSTTRVRRGIGWLAGGVAIGGLALFVACLEATQVDAELTADSSLCTGARARYFVRVRRLSPDPRAAENENDALVRQNDGELDTCDANAPSTLLGNYTLLPEGDEAREATQEVQFVLNTLGTDPAECVDSSGGAKRAIPLNCVVIRRRVKFVAHARAVVPMYLDDRCRGVSCEQDATCFRGACKPAEAPCDPTTARCVPTHERESGNPNGVGFDPARAAALPPGAVAFTDAGNVLLSDGRVVAPDGSAVPDVSSLVDTSVTGDTAVDTGADASTGADGASDPSDGELADGFVADTASDSARVGVDGKVPPPPP